MRFIQCSINGQRFGREAALGKMDGGINVSAEDLENAPPLPSGDSFIDEAFAAKLQEKDPAVDAFFRLLAICHTVRSELVAGQMEFQAQSPDEKALVEGAR